VEAFAEMESLPIHADSLRCRVDRGAEDAK